MPKFDKILISVVLAAFVPFVTGQLDVETVYELLTRRIDNIQTSSQILRNKINDMDDKMDNRINSLDQQMDNRINSLDQQMKTLDSRFDSFEDNTKKHMATVEMLTEAVNNNTETQKLETDIERNVHSQALAVRKMLSDEKSILRQTVEEFSRSVNAFRDNITIQISAFVNGVQAELLASNRSFEVKLNKMFEVASSNSIAAESDIRKLSADIKSTSEDLNMTLRSEIEQLNNYLNTSLERMKVTHGEWSSWSSWSSCFETCTRARLRHCTNPSPSTYGHMCQGSSVDKENCNTFACAHTLFVRLVDKLVFMWHVGELEVSLDKINWGKVCDDDHYSNVAKVASGMLGKPSVRLLPYSNPSSGLIFLSGVECRGNETSLLHCKHNGWKVGNCSHNWVVYLYLQ